MLGDKKPHKPNVPHNAWELRLERKIKQQRNDISKLSEMAREIVTRNHQWLRRKLADTPVSEALETAKQCLIALAG